MCNTVIVFKPISVVENTYLVWEFKFNLILDNGYFLKLIMNLRCNRNFNRNTV